MTATNREERDDMVTLHSPGTGELLIATLEGVMRASIGDWIIRGVAGEFYPCKDSIFSATYEPADEPRGES